LQKSRRSLTPNILHRHERGNSLRSSCTHSLSPLEECWQPHQRKKQRRDHVHNEDTTETRKDTDLTEEEKDGRTNSRHATRRHRPTHFLQSHLDIRPALFLQNIGMHHVQRIVNRKPTEDDQGYSLHQPKAPLEDAGDRKKRAARSCKDGTGRCNGKKNVSHEEEHRNHCTHEANDPRRKGRTDDSDLGLSTNEQLCIWHNLTLWTDLRILRGHEFLPCRHEGLRLLPRAVGVKLRPEAHTEPSETPRPKFYVQMVVVNGVASQKRWKIMMQLS